MPHFPARRPSLDGTVLDGSVLDQALHLLGIHRRFAHRSTALLTAVVMLLGLSVAGTALAAELHSGGQLARAGAATPPRSLPLPVVHASGHNGEHPAKPASAKPRHLIDATVLVSGATALTHHQLVQLRAIPGVDRTQTVSAGHAKIDGHSAYVLGVVPKTFRPWTPKLTAVSNPLWASVSSGELTASFDMGHNAKLPLGSTVPVASRQTSDPVRIGAFATIGMAGVDAIVSHHRANQLGLAPTSGVLISAPKASNPLAIRDAAKAILGKHAHAELLNEVIVTRDAGEFLTRLQITRFLQAAESRLGAPYVWGATGPNSFDCSGLVQWAFAQEGITMPRVAQEQFFAGPHVPYSDARPGDLIFYHYEPNDPTFVSHVAIYLGNGEMLEAPHTGENVKIIPVPLPDMAGVVRVDPSVASQVA